MVRLPIAKTSMEINDKLFLRVSKETSLQVRSEIISPAKAAALPASPEASKLGDGSPTAVTIGDDEID